nr:hypothetical protein [Prevotella sp.]
MFQILIYYKIKESYSWKQKEDIITTITEMEVNKEVVDTRNITVAEQDTIVTRDHRSGEES